MRKVIIGLLSMFLIVGTVSAQTGKKALKKASKAVAKYNANPAENADKLTETMSMLSAAMESDEVTSSAKSYNTIGGIYNDIIDGEWKASLLGGAEIATVDAAFNGADAYIKALGMAEKKADKKDAIKGLQVSEALLNNVGVKFFEKQEYGAAFDYFNRAIDVYKVISESGGESRLDDEVTRNEHLYVTAASGYYGDRKADAKPVFKQMFDAGSDKALVYEALFNIANEEGDEANALTYLEKGREMFPDDSGLLFAEINLYLKQGKLDELTNKLKSAIEKEPDNTSIYITLGNVYDQLNQKERDAGNDAKADEYFDQAMDYYNQTLTKDPKNFDAVYSQGALYYNKAAGMTDAINALSEDYTPAGTKKYDALKAKMDGLFSSALPYFEKADKMATEAGTPDLNTIIALKEIYARTNQLEKVGPLKARMEAIQAGN